MRGRKPKEKKSDGKGMEDGIFSRSPGSQTYVLPCDPDTGKMGPKWVTIHGTKTDAIRAKRRDLVQIEKGQFAPEPSTMTLGEYLEWYLDNVKHKRSNTYEDYVSSFNALKKCLYNNLVLSDIRLSEIRTETLQQAVNELSDRLTSGSVDQYFTVFKAALKHAVKLKYIASNPCDYVIVAKPESEEKAIWDIQQQNKFLMFCQETTLRYAALFVLLLKTGSRIGEILALRWSDVDLVVRTIHITRAVSGKGYGPPKSKRSTTFQGYRKIALKA